MVEPNRERLYAPALESGFSDYFIHWLAPVAYTGGAG
jgi:hypothetical protein